MECPTMERKGMEDTQKEQKFHLVVHLDELWLS